MKRILISTLYSFLLLLLTQSCYTGRHYTINPTDYQDTLFVYVDKELSSKYLKYNKDIKCTFSKETNLYKYILYQDNLTLYTYLCKKGISENALRDSLALNLPISYLLLENHNGQRHLIESKKEIINFFEINGNITGTQRRIEY